MRGCGKNPDLGYGLTLRSEKKIEMPGTNPQKWKRKKDGVEKKHRERPLEWKP